MSRSLDVVKDIFPAVLHQKKLIIRWCGSMAEQLIRNEQVAGSIPVTSSKQNSPQPFRMGTVLLVEFCLHNSISFLH